MIFILWPGGRDLGGGYGDLVNLLHAQSGYGI